MSEDPPRTDEYQGCARLYDPLLNPLLDRPRRHVAALVEHCLRPFAKSEGPPPPVLDLCCGTGRQAVFLLERGLRVHGLDLSPAMLRTAQRTTSPRINYVHGNAAATGYADRSFGCVCVSLALHEKPPHTREEILEESMRLLLPGGSLVLLDYRWPESAAGRGAMRLASLVERLAGAEHFANYRQFLAGGGIRALLGASRLPFRRVQTFFHGSMGLYRVFTHGCEEA
ncbi:Methyltransferase domain-containing protein [Paucidesulfovibrio gracilis DSM 16080]|uniref:Methyltransferase domain-containing protein n=1 Tax=Paucidesulfovibrio gracilis DSM 16080 TaxID=1121449 RepID=A0A1T4WYH5_9BACT|nr:class I SAM-dependent methyltransferase [Paucidesulfovibrio gracilis]SKA82217.1 Methyltransferase domain-containing protein [Paucidesulfovibrio gracilis DSM 16080]